MSRLGDLILLERTRQKLTRKQVARKCGVSEGYIKDVEEGRRIIQDDQARRILKTLGTSQRNEAEFSLDEIAATVDLVQFPAKPAPQKAEAPKPAPKPASAEEQSGIWLDALSRVLQPGADYERRLCPNRPPHAADSGWQNRRRKAGARALFPSAG